jgi:hypothetical protein
MISHEEMLRQKLSLPLGVVAIKNVYTVFEKKKKLSIYLQYLKCSMIFVSRLNFMFMKHRDFPGLLVCYLFHFVSHRMLAAASNKKPLFEHKINKENVRNSVV